MKVLILFVLVVFSGCNASPLSADKPKPKLDMLIDTLSHPAEVVQAFKRTEIGQGVSARLEEGEAVARRFAEEAWDGLPLEAKDAIAGAYLKVMKLGMAAYVAWDRSELRKMLWPVAVAVNSIARDVETELTQKAQQVKDVVSPHFETLVEKVEPVAQHVQARLETLYESFVKSS